MPDVASALRDELGRLAARAGLKPWAAHGSNAAPHPSSTSHPPGLHPLDVATLVSVSTGCSMPGPRTGDEFAAQSVVVP